MSTLIINKCFCKETSSPIIDSQTGEILCRKCGLVFEDKISSIDGPQILFSTANITHEQQRDKYHDKGLGTKTPKLKNHSSMSNHIADIVPNEVRIIRKIMFDIGPILDQISATNQIRTESYYFVRKVVLMKLSSGSAHKEIAGACVYASCKRQGKVISEKEFVTTNEINRKIFRKILNLIISEFNVKSKTPTEQTVLLINKICSDLNLSQKTMRESLDYFYKLKPSRVFEGKNPFIVVSAIIFLVVKTVKLKDISSLTRTSNVGIKNMRKEIEKIKLQ
jgi:transcription initiation factor TFIIIB Brf1 subunit/transcription initiation factor TFIIB